MFYLARLLIMSERISASYMNNFYFVMLMLPILNAKENNQNCMNDKLVTYLPLSFQNMHFLWRLLKEARKGLLSLRL